MSHLTCLNHLDILSFTQRKPALVKHTVLEDSAGFKVLRTIYACDWSSPFSVKQTKQTNKKTAPFNTNLHCICPCYNICWHCVTQANSSHTSTAETVFKHTERACGTPAHQLSTIHLQWSRVWGRRSLFCTVSLRDRNDSPSPRDSFPSFRLN